MANTKFKLGYGKKEDIWSAISKGLLDGGDLVITKNTKELAFITPSKDEIMFIKSQIGSFDSIEDAEKYASSDASAYEGELITVVGDTAKTYRLQKAETGYQLEDVNPVKHVEVVDTFPESNINEGVIYICGDTGKIWDGENWVLLFDDMQSIKDELDKKVDMEDLETVVETKVETSVNNAFTIKEV